MNKQNLKSFSHSFTTVKSKEEMHSILLNVKKWWSGIYSETIKGNSKKVNDEFSFSAGGGAHYSKQKLVELIPYSKIVWLVTESNLSFLTNASEWVGTKICFDISTNGNKTKVTFTHEGLTPKFECYGGCSGAWTNYLENLEKAIQQ
jgi:hypothetical protein